MQCSVTLGDDEAKRRGTRKSVLERAAMPTFDACIEMLDRDQWRVHMDLATSVDNILAGHNSIQYAQDLSTAGTLLMMPTRSAHRLYLAVSGWTTLWQATCLSSWFKTCQQLHTVQLFTVHC